MILPKKQLSIEESMIGFGGFLLGGLRESKTVDDLWYYYITALQKKEYHTRFSFDQFILVIDFLYMIGAIRNDEGILTYDNQ